MCRTRSLIQSIFMVVAIAHTFESAAAERPPFRKPLLLKELSQQDDKQKDIYSKLFWKSLNTIYRNIPHGILCTVLNGRPVNRYSEQSIIGLEAALASNTPIANSRKGRSPLMAAMQKYVQWDHPAHTQEFENIVIRLAKREKKHAEKIKVLCYAIEQASLKGVRIMLNASIDISNEPTPLVYALGLCTQWLALCDIQHELIIADLLEKNADRSLAKMMAYEWELCCSRCPANKIFEQAQPARPAIADRPHRKKDKYESLYII